MFIDGQSRRSMRLKANDYTRVGAYFVTLCAAQRTCLFGTIIDDISIPSEIGSNVTACWNAIPNHFPGIELDAFMLMPNHFHGLVVLAAASAPSGRESIALVPRVARSPESRSLGAVIGSFKAAASREWGRSNAVTGTPLWQRNYYEHIIRGERDLERIRTYIRLNPSRWNDDQENPCHIGRPR